MKQEDEEAMKIFNDAYMTPSIEREEEWKMNMRVDYEGYLKHEKRIKDMLKHDPGAREGDHINISYSLNVSYLGGVASCLETLLALREEGYNLKINIEEMTHGKSLLADILTHVDTITNSGEASP